MKWFNIIFGLLVILMGSLPFIGEMLPEVFEVLPQTGDAYSLIILVLGVVIVGYNLKRR